MNKKEQIRVLNVSVCGALHKAKNLGCQDYAAYKCSGKKMVAVVSDGAGSAKYGKIGAKIIAETLCNLLLKSNLKNFKNDLIKAIMIARNKVMFHRLNVTKSEKSLRDFSATLVGVFYDGSTGIFFHIGDGAGVAFLDDECNNYVISEPENGAFSFETFFYTMDNWKDCLRFTEFSTANSLVLMTDGVTGFVFDENFSEIRNNFLVPIIRYLESESRKTYAQSALKNTLDSSQARRINFDDKTMLWAKLR